MISKITSIFILFILISCKSSECEYANYEFYKDGNNEPFEEFQIILHSVTEKRLEIIGKNYMNDKFWKFKSGNYIILNDSLKISIDENFFNESNDVDYFYSTELTKSQLGFLITGEIKIIEIVSGSEKHLAKLSSVQIRKFNQVLNCNYIKSREQLENLR